VPHPAPNQDLGGQCVTLIKALLEFLGAPNPYAARGNAISVNDTLLRQGIAQPGKGWLTIVVNRDMGYIGGVHYGHIWADLAGEANYESNGNRALYTTKNTRPITQGQQFVNLDNYIKEGNGIMDNEDAKEVYRGLLHREPENDQVWRGFVGKRYAEASRIVKASPEWLGQNHAIVFFAQREQQLNEARAQLANANTQLKAALDNDAADKAAIVAAQKKAEEALAKLNTVTNNFNDVKAKLDEAKASEELAVKTGNAFTRWIGEQLNKILGGK
jgi:hypothetical protein